MTTLTDPNVTGASAILKQQLAAWGLPTLYTDALRILKQGLNADAVVAELQATAAYKQRFWYNDVRLKAGLPVLSPAEAVATENSFRQLARQFDLPKGFFDSVQDVGNFIAKNMSVSEFADRAQTAQEKWLGAPAETQAWWKSHYGATDGDAIAAILNPDKALPLIQRKLNSAALGGAAQRQGLSLDATRAEQLTSFGITGDQAQAGYGEVAATLQGDSTIAARFGSTFDQTDAENAVLLKDAGSIAKKQKLDAAEEGMFGGRAATNAAGLSGGSGGR